MKYVSSQDIRGRSLNPLVHRNERERAGEEKRPRGKEKGRTAFQGGVLAFIIGSSPGGSFRI